MTTATNCPPCPACKLPSVCGPGPRDLVCGGCGLLWTGTAEQRAQAELADIAHEELLRAEDERLRESAQAAADRKRARAMFTDAGQPIPAWLREEG